MASKKQLKPITEDSHNSASGNDSSCGNNSGARKKTKPSGTFVKSRYMQTDKKSFAVKSNPQNESVLVPPRPASPKTSGVRRSQVLAPPRRTLSTQADPNTTSVMPSILETSSFGGNVLQSTALDGHCLHPDFDLSVIKETAALPSTAVDPKSQKRNLELDTFLLAFITAKIEDSNHRLKKEAERNLLFMMEEEEKLRSKVMSMKRQYLLLEKEKQLSNLLDMQIEALTPAAATAKPFAEEYKTFAAAIDTTRHELPVKNFHIEEDRGEFLNKAVDCLKQSQCALDYVKDVSPESENTAECLKEIKTTVQDIEQQLHSASSNLLELSTLVTRETVLVQQSLEEEKIGLNTLTTLLST